MLRGPCREDMQQKCKISRQRLSDVIDGITGIGGKGNDKAEGNRRETHGLRVCRINVSMVKRAMRVET